MMASSKHPPAPPSTSSPRSARLHRIRIELRRGGSAAMDACELLEGRDYALAARLVDGAERLVARLATLERRAA
jgi:hypothetical protein